MIYFIHDQTSRTIKIGCAWNPNRRLSVLQISTSNKLVLLGKIAGTKKVEKEVHGLVYRHCGKLPGERPLCVSGEWFDDRILPFVTELMAAPKNFLEQKPKKPPRTRPQDNDLRNCSLALVCDSGEAFRESFTLKTATAELALTALTNIANARLAFLANSVRITRLVVPGSSREVNLRGAFATKCNPRDGLAVTLNSEAGGGRMMLGGIKQYAYRRFHGAPPEFYEAVSRWFVQPTAECNLHLTRFAQVLNQNHCVIVAQTVLPVREVLPDGIGPLPKGELRSKVNQKAASKRRERVLTARSKDGIVYFIQDAVTSAIKIGFCLKKPEKRLAALQTGNSNPLRLVGHVSGSEAHESRLHGRFSRFRIQGEWFSSAILADVDAILKCASLESWLARPEPDAPVTCGPSGPEDPERPA
jgi:hypothetical protein